MSDDDGAPARSGDRGSAAEGPEPVPRDRWDKIAILGRPLAASLTALTVAVVGWWAQLTLAEQGRQETERARNAQQEMTERAEIEQRTRLYSELMGRREEAEAGLRKDMFTTILRDFFEAGTAPSAEERISRQLLKLELLALNFGESLSLSPLFFELADDIDQAGTAGSETLRLDSRYRKRLNSLARRVSGWQLAALQSGGRVFRVEIPYEIVDRNASHSPNRYHWPEDQVRAEEQLQGGADPGLFDLQMDSLSVHELDDVKHRFEMTFSEGDYDKKTVHVKLTITYCGWVGPRHEGPDASASESTCAAPRNRGGTLVRSRPIVREFDLDFFDFPMIDNTRLAEDQRFAMVLEEFRPDQITILAAYFPGLYSSQRDKPFLDVVIQQLQEHGLPAPETRVPEAEDEKLDVSG